MEESLHRVRRALDAAPQRSPIEHAVSGSNALDTSAFLGGVERNARLVAAVAFLSLVLGYVYAYHVADVSYRASASIVLRPDPVELIQEPDLQREAVLSTEEINTERAILVSASNLGEVVRILNLTEDPEFNPYLSGADAPEESVRDEYFLTATLGTLEKVVRAENVVGTTVVRTIVESESAPKAQLIANTVVDRYVAAKRANEEEARLAQTNRLSEKLLDLQEQLSRVESQIAGFQFQATGAEERTRDNVQLELLDAEANAIRQLQKSVFSRYAELSVDRGGARGGTAILDRAELPLEPYSPRHKLILAASLVIGCFLGLCLAMIRETLSDRIRSRADLAKLSGGVVIPTGTTLGRSRRFGKMRSQFGLDQPSMVIAMENVRNTIRLGSKLRSEAPRSIAVVSSMPEEGKTPLAISLAASYAEVGFDVLLIDSDLRGRALSGVLAATASRGVATAVTGHCELADAVEHNEALGLDVLPCEVTPRNAMDILSSQQFEALLKTARDSYDMVIIDTAPLMAVADARAVCRVADYVLYAAAQDVTRSTELREALGELGAVGETVDAFVLSNAKQGQFEGARGRLRRNYFSRKGKKAIAFATSRG